jgi:hypothetical protein
MTADVRIGVIFSVPGTGNEIGAKASYTQASLGVEVRHRSTRVPKDQMIGRLEPSDF